MDKDREQKKKKRVENNERSGRAKEINEVGGIKRDESNGEEEDKNDDNGGGVKE